MLPATEELGSTILWLPKTPSELKMQWFRAFVRSWWYHDELSFCCPFRFGHLQFSNPCRPAGGDPSASSSTRGFPEECTAAFAPPALRPAPAEATFPDLANLLDQSHGADGLHRLLCGADSDLPGSV